MPPLSVTMKEFCRLVGVGRSKAFELKRNGAVDVVKIDGKVLITYDSILRLIERNISKGGN